MKPKQMRLVAIAAAALIAFAAGLGLGLGLGMGAGPQPGHVLCTANPCRITMTRNGSAGLVVSDAPGPKEENAFLIIDPHGLAEFWQNASGAYEGPRGELCTTNAELAPVACLRSDGMAGWLRIGSEILTTGDLAWLHREEHATRPADSREPLVPAASRGLRGSAAAPSYLGAH